MPRERATWCTRFFIRNFLSCLSIGGIFDQKYHITRFDKLWQLFSDSKAFWGLRCIFVGFHSILGKSKTTSALLKIRQLFSSPFMALRGAGSLPLSPFNSLWPVGVFLFKINMKVKTV
jgi:hypothetical protein